MVSSRVRDGIDMPELESIQMGKNAFRYQESASTELIMQSRETNEVWWLDLPKLTSLTTNQNSRTFERTHNVIFEGDSHSHWHDA